MAKSLIGRTVCVLFGVYNDGNGRRGVMYVDDVALSACAPATRTPTATATNTGTAYSHAHDHADGHADAHADRNAEPACGIYGTITYKGVAKGSITVALRRWNTQTNADVSIKSVSTNRAGLYLFTSVPTLGANEVYYVYFGTNRTNSNYVFRWICPNIETYVIGQMAHGGNFDIADIKLSSPDAGVTVTFPASFTWQNAQ